MGSKELDFIWRLNDYINTLDLYTKSNVGILDEGNSIGLLDMSDGQEVCFHDGVRDKEYRIQINAKSRKQAECIESLSKISKELENLEAGAITSNNNTFDFENIKTTSFVSIIMQDEQGYFLYQVSLIAKITIYRE